MSTVVALKKGKSVWVGADRLLSWDSLSRSDMAEFSKLLVLDQAVIGCTGLTLYITALNYFLHKNPDLRSHPFEDTRQVLDFFLQYNQFLRQNFDLGHANNNEVSRISNAKFLVVTQSCMYEVADNKDVTVFENYTAIGSGKFYALGALHTLQSGNHTPQVMVKQALQAASHFDPMTGGEIEVVQV